MKKLKFIPLLALLVAGCSHLEKNKNVKIIPVSEVEWQKLNPARGVKSPQAATLWGDRNGSEATGFLAKFMDGFSSPPHIHNVSYRAIVIEGLIHNDDPKAENMWMPKGSYWTQPAGEAHITSAKGSANMALVEIDKAPYLVRPVSLSFDNGERPYNIHVSNIIWKDEGSHKYADLWKDQNESVTGKLLKFNDTLNYKVTDSKVVVVSGDLSFKGRSLAPGSLISVDGETILNLSCLIKDCLIYLKFN